MHFWPPQVYIVYIGEHSGEKTLNEIEDNHHSYLLSVKKNEVEARASLIYSYRHSINGFAAMLALGEASKLSSNKQKHHMGLFPINKLFFFFLFLFFNFYNLILKKWFWTELKEVVSVYQSIPRKYSVGLLDNVSTNFDSN